MLPTPNSYSLRIRSNNSTFVLLSIPRPPAHQAGCSGLRRVGQSTASKWAVSRYRNHREEPLGDRARHQGLRAGRANLVRHRHRADYHAGQGMAEGKLDERLKLVTQPQLLICDEIGYLPIDRQGANLFFPLVARRYERGSIIITSNQSG